MITFLSVVVVVIGCVQKLREFTHAELAGRSAESRAVSRPTLESLYVTNSAAWR